MNSKLALTIAAVTLVGLISIFSVHVNTWTSATFAELGTFLGGILGPFAILIAAIQYFESSNAQRAATRFAMGDRHRIDLRTSYEKQVDRLEKALSQEVKLTEERPNISLKELLGSVIFMQAKNSLPDFQRFELEAKFQPEGAWPASTVYLFEKLARIGLDLSELLVISAMHDRISGNNVLGAECRRTYGTIISNLTELNYPIKREPVDS